MANTRKTWITILIAFFIIAGITAIGLVAGTAYWVSRHVSTQLTSPESAEEEFSREQARFGGQQPLIEISGSGDNPTFRKSSNAEEDRLPGELKALHARFYDPGEGKMVRADIPFWLIRIGGSFSFMSDRGSVTLEDLERHGPGLIVNGTSPDGEQVLIWID
jgi:hypothetical protein